MATFSGFESVEVCAGGGGQALGFEQAGFRHVCLVENDPHCAATLRLNRPNWHVVETDLRTWKANSFKGVDLVAAGLPCPPFSVAGKQLGDKDERNLFPTVIRIIDEIRPKAVLIENVPGILDAVFDDFRRDFQGQVEAMGFKADWKLLNACDFGVPQLRPRVAFVAVRKMYSEAFSWPEGGERAPTVGERLYDLMTSRGWRKAREWKERASEIAPTLVGGSHKHGGPDLGPTRAKRAWATLGVNGHLLANDSSERDFVGMPSLTVRMCARLQGFPDDWQFSGKKTASYRQVGNAFPPPVAKAVGMRLREALSKKVRVVVAA